MDDAELEAAEAVIGAFDDPAAILDSAGRVAVCNDAWRRNSACPLCGPGLAVPGANYAAELASYQGSASEAATQFCELLRETLESSGSAARQFTFRSEAPASTPRWWRSRVRLSGAERQLAVVTHRDISRERAAEEELRRSRARLRTIMTGAPIVLFAIDPGGVFSLVEGMGAAGAAFVSPDLVGQSVYEAYAQIPNLLEVVREAFAGRVGVTTIEVGRIAYEVRCAPYVGSSGNSSGVVGVATDVTERVKAQRMKDEFVSIVSHELRTPLTSIRGSLGLLEGGVAGELPEKAQELTKIARVNADRLMRLINDILDLEKMESGQMELNRTAVDLFEITTRVTEELESLATLAGVELRVESQPGAMVRADPDRIHQVVTNLLSNAIKFSSEGDPVTIGLSTPNDRHIRLSVRDQGPGIATRDLDRIFQKFTQVDSSTSRAKMGSGLGLVIAKSIVEAHGGAILVESEVGTGSTFIVDLPRDAPPVPRAGGTFITPARARELTMSMTPLVRGSHGSAATHAKALAQGSLLRVVLLDS